MERVGTDTDPDRRLVIAVDCDDVLIPTALFFMQAYNRRYGTAVRPDQLSDYSEELWQADVDTRVQRYTDLTYSDAYRALGPSPQEATILRRLSRQHELHLVTARHEHEREITQAVLDRELVGVFTSMEFVGWGGSKGQVCRRIAADMLIDDNPAHLADALQHGLPAGGVILFGDYPWVDYAALPAGAVRCKTWPKVEEYVDAWAAA